MIVALVFAAGLVCGYVLAGLLLALSVWTDADNPEWRLHHWASAITFGPVVVLRLIVRGRST